MHAIGWWYTWSKKEECNDGPILATTSSMHTSEYIIWSIGTGVRMHTIVVWAESNKSRQPPSQPPTRSFLKSMRLNLCPANFEGEWTYVEMTTGGRQTGLMTRREVPAGWLDADEITYYAYELVVCILASSMWSYAYYSRSTYSSRT